MIVDSFPDLSESRYSVLATGWDSVAVEVDDRLIFKFPRHPAAQQRLLVEARLIALVRPAVTLPVPDLTLVPGSRPFSRHVKLQGEHLVTSQYDCLPLEARNHLAEDLALFYAELHHLDRHKLEAAGARPIEPWLQPDDILQRACPILPPNLREFMEETIARWRCLPPDPYGITYGFFDGHGRNMAFDHARQRLNGIYDFGDSGFGSLHQEFIYSNIISRDLTMRIIASYERITGRILDRERINVLFGVLRLSELAQHADVPSLASTALKSVADWVATR